MTRYLSRELYIPIPYTALLLCIGILMGLSEYRGTMPFSLTDAVVAIKTMSPHLLLGIFIPPLIFESAFGAEYHVIRREFWQAVLLAFPGVVINVLLTTLFCLYVLQYHWSWWEALTFSSIVSATDPVAVVALLRDLGASKRLATLIEGESLLNDGSAYVCFVIFLRYLKTPDDLPSVGENIGEFCELTFGGIFTGLVFGFCSMIWLRLVFDQSGIEIVITLVTAYLCFWVCEYAFVDIGETEMSGILGVVFCGLVISKYKSAITPSV